MEANMIIKSPKTIIEESRQKIEVAKGVFKIAFYACVWFNNNYKITIVKR